MRKFAIAITIMFALTSVLVAAEPELLLEAVFSSNPAWLYFVAGVRFVYGATLISAAGASRFPRTLRVFGGLSILGGFILLGIGVEGVRDMFESIDGQNPRLMSFPMALAYVFFMFILYALTPPREDSETSDSHETKEGIPS